MSRILGITVSIRPKSVGGELILSYETLEQLDTLIRKLSSRPQTKTKKDGNQEIVSADDSAVEEDVIQMDNEEIGEVVFDDSFSNALEDDVISLDKLDD